MFLTGCGQKETSSSGSANPSKTTVNFEGRTVKIWSGYQADPRKNEAAKSSSTYEEDCAKWDQIEKDFNCTIEILTEEDFDFFRNGFLNAYASGEVIARCHYRRYDLFISHLDHQRHAAAPG